MAGQSFDVARRLRRIAKHFANSRNCVVQAVVKIDECFSGPDSRLKFLASDNLAGTFQQHLEQVEGLAAQAQPYAVLAQFSGMDIQLISVEPQLVGNRPGGHSNLQKNQKSLSQSLGAISDLSGHAGTICLQRLRHGENFGNKWRRVVLPRCRKSAKVQW